jgi:Family of unknown function (DUF6492)
MATIDLFIKSYKKDFWLLALSLATIKKNVTGYENIILLIPENDKNEFETRFLPERTLIHYVSDYSNGWLGQQVYKLQSYKYSYADFIFFTDSDAFVCNPVNLQDLIKDDRPEILFTDYGQLLDAQIWKPYVEAFIREPVQYEFMRRLPLIYHRSTLVAISEYQPDLERVIMQSDRYSEFNIMGAYAYKFERDKYNFINTDSWSYVPPVCEQVWSHATDEEGADELHLREFIRTLRTLLKAFSIIVP